MLVQLELAGVQKAWVALAHCKRLRLQLPASCSATSHLSAEPDAAATCRVLDTVTYSNMLLYMSGMPC
jgi:hypothetical protein